MSLHLLINAVQIKEGQRMHPAVAWGLPRVVPEGGLKIGDQFFPAGVCITHKTPDCVADMTMFRQS